eukprot:1675648-Pyramimonas_sp.AAC.1
MEASSQAADGGAAAPQYLRCVSWNPCWASRADRLEEIKDECRNFDLVQLAGTKTARSGADGQVDSRRAGGRIVLQ